MMIEILRNHMIATATDLRVVVLQRADGHHWLRLSLRSGRIMSR